jgi:hypothetical protein
LLAGPVEALPLAAGIPVLAEVCANGKGIGERITKTIKTLNLLHWLTGLIDETAVNMPRSSTMFS